LLKNQVFRGILFGDLRKTLRIFAADQNTFRNAEHIVPRPARYIVLFAKANNISYRRQPIYLAPSADGASQKGKNPPQRIF